MTHRHRRLPGSTPSEADRLRRAMATFRQTGTIHTFREKLVDAAWPRERLRPRLRRTLLPADRGLRRVRLSRKAMRPASHCLVYVSAWLKRRYPAAFAAVPLLNSQPMGFLRAGADRPGRPRPRCIDGAARRTSNFSGWDCALELSPDKASPYALRLGLRQIKGLKESDADWLTAARGNGYDDPAAIWRRAGLNGQALEVLARADAFASMGLTRREGLWAARRFVAAAKTGDAKPLPLFEAAGESGWGAEQPVTLPDMSPGEAVAADYQALRLSLRDHPMALLRDDFPGSTLAVELKNTKDGSKIIVAGLVLARQRPGTAKGVIFATLEDETGTANVIVWPKTFERFRRIVLTSRLLKVTGELQREGIVTHLIAAGLEDCSALLDGLAAPTPGDADRPVPTPPRRHPREQAKILFPSREFH